MWYQPFLYSLISEHQRFCKHKQLHSRILWNQFLYSTKMWTQFTSHSWSTNSKPSLLFLIHKQRAKSVCIYPCFIHVPFSLSMTISLAGVWTARLNVKHQSAYINWKWLDDNVNYVGDVVILEVKAFDSSHCCVPSLVHWDYMYECYFQNSVLIHR